MFWKQHVADRWIPDTQWVLTNWLCWVIISIGPTVNKSQLNFNHNSRSFIRKKCIWKSPLQNIDNIIQGTVCRINFGSQLVWLGSSHNQGAPLSSVRPRCDTQAPAMPALQPAAPPWSARRPPDNVVAESERRSPDNGATTPVWQQTGTLWQI